MNYRAMIGLTMAAITLLLTGCFAEISRAESKRPLIALTVPNQIHGEIRWNIYEVDKLQKQSYCSIRFKEEFYDAQGASLKDLDFGSSNNSFLVPLASHACKSAQPPFLRVLNVEPKEFERIHGYASKLATGKSNSPELSSRLNSALKDDISLLSLSKGEEADTYRLSFYKAGFFHSLTFEVGGEKLQGKVLSEDEWQ